MDNELAAKRDAVDRMISQAVPPPLVVSETSIQQLRPLLEELLDYRELAGLKEEWSTGSSGNPVIRAALLAREKHLYTWFNAQLAAFGLTLDEHEFDLFIRPIATSEEPTNEELEQELRSFGLNPDVLRADMSARLEKEVAKYKARGEEVPSRLAEMMRQFAEPN